MLRQGPPRGSSGAGAGRASSVGTRSTPPGRPCSPALFPPSAPWPPPPWAWLLCVRPEPTRKPQVPCGGPHTCRPSRWGDPTVSLSQSLLRLPHSPLSLTLHQRAQGGKGDPTLGLPQTWRDPILCVTHTLMFFTYSSVSHLLFCLTHSLSSVSHTLSSSLKLPALSFSHPPRSSLRQSRASPGHPSLD